MPRTNIASQRPTRAGAVLAAATAGVAADDHTITNTGRTLLLIKNTNGSATARTVEFEFGITPAGQTVAPITRSIPAGQTWLFGGFSTRDFGRSLKVNVDHAELTIQVIEP